MFDDKKKQLLSMMREYAKTNPYAVFSYTNAALLYGTPRWDKFSLEIHTVQPSSKLRNKKVTTHIHPYFGKSIKDGMNVITLLDLLLEISVYDSTISAISSISHHLHKQELTTEQIIKYCDVNKWKSGVAKLKHFLIFASESDESPFETKVRLKLYELGFIMPIQQVEIACQNNRKYRVDFLFAFNNRKVILEADGLSKYSENELVRSDERQREADLIREGYELMRVMYSEIESGRFEQRLLEYDIQKRRYYGKKIEKVRY